MIKQEGLYKSMQSNPESLITTVIMQGRTEEFNNDRRELGRLLQSFPLSEAQRDQITNHVSHWVSKAERGAFFEGWEFTIAIVNDALDIRRGQTHDGKTGT
jgi:hypothetical protein